MISKIKNLFKPSITENKLMKDLQEMISDFRENCLSKFENSLNSKKRIQKACFELIFLFAAAQKILLIEKFGDDNIINDYDSHIYKKTKHKSFYLNRTNKYINLYLDNDDKSFKKKIPILFIQFLNGENKGLDGNIVTSDFQKDLPFLNNVYYWWNKIFSKTSRYLKNKNLKNIET